MVSTKLDHNKIKNHINDSKTRKNIPELIRFKLSLAACACFCPLDCVSSVIISPTAVEDACKPPIKKGRRKKVSAILFCLSRCFSFFFLTIIGKVEIDKKTTGRGKRERRKEKACLLVLLMLWPCFLARRRSRRTFFISFLFLYFPLYNDDVLCFETVIEKTSWGFSQV